MNNRRKLIVGVLVATMALTGVLVGTISADDQTSAASRGTLMARVAELLGIDQATVEDAFEQAMTEQREARQAEMEAAREAHLQDLIDEGVVTQEQVDEWESWLQARPDLGDGFAMGPGGRGGVASGFGPRGMMGRGWIGRGFAEQCPMFDDD